MYKPKTDIESALVTFSLKLLIDFVLINAILFTRMVVHKVSELQIGVSKDRLVSYGGILWMKGRANRINLYYLLN